jgi:hypothetical protein
MCCRPFVPRAPCTAAIRLAVGHTDSFLPDLFLPLWQANRHRPHPLPTTASPVRHAARKDVRRDRSSRATCCTIVLGVLAAEPVVLTEPPVRKHTSGRLVANRAHRQVQQLSDLFSTQQPQRIRRCLSPRFAKSTNDLAKCGHQNMNVSRVALGVASLTRMGWRHG